MRFDEDKSVYKIGISLGYLLMFTVFNLIFYFVLSFLNRLPDEKGYLISFPIACLLVFSGKAIKHWVSK